MRGTDRVYPNVLRIGLTQLADHVDVEIVQLVFAD